MKLARQRRWRLPAKSCVALATLMVAILAAKAPAQAVTVYANDTFARSVSGGWGTADSGGAWTVADTAANWSVSGGAGSITVAPNGQERAYLGAVSVQDVEVLTEVVLPRSTQSTQAITYVLGRYAPGANPGYYRIGVGQNAGGSTVILRPQRSDGTTLSPDLDTGVPSGEGVAVWMRVQFEGASPTAIRARVWRDGATEPAGWLLDVTDANPAQQISGRVGVRARNEDTAAAHTFGVRRFQAASFVPDPIPTPTVLASDAFSRGVASGWESAPTGGFWTTIGTPWNWSVAPGSGHVSVMAGGDELSYLSAVNTRDIDINTKVTLPRSAQANGAFASVLGRYVPAYMPTYYSVGVGQGSGASIILRAQRNDGVAVGVDVDTGIPAQDGIVVRLHVQFAGVRPTAVRARVWLDGTAEPSTWMLDATDANGAQQAAGAVGVRARNEDTSSPRIFNFLSYDAFGTPVAKSQPPPNPTGGALHHYLYVAPDKGADVFDIDNNHAFVKHIELPTSGAVGIMANAATGTLYIAECGSANCTSGNGGQILKYNLLTDTVAWVAYYPFGVDSPAITPDGAVIYSPDGESQTDGLWHTLDGASGAPTGSIFANVGGHNTIVSPNGSHAYLGGFMNGPNTTYLQVVTTATNTITKRLGPLRGGVRPFTINGAETLAFTTASNFLGFQVSSTATGQVLYTVPIAGFSYTTFITDAPSHGISMSPDEREIYVVDGPNSYVHVFDVTGLPGAPPVQVADIALLPFSGNSSPCVVRCEREGWLLHSGDGRYMYVGDSGDVIDTATRTIAINLNALRNTRKLLEVDWQNGTTIFTTTRSGVGYVGASGSPTPTPTSGAAATATRTGTVTRTPVPSSTPSATSTATASATRTSTGTATAVNTATPASTATATAVNTATATSTATATATASATQTPTPVATATDTPEAATNTTTPTATATETPTMTPVQGCVGDADCDGCPDVNELGANPLRGGDRDPNYTWDFFDVPLPPLSPTAGGSTRNHVITLGDVIAVLAYTGTRDGGAPNSNGMLYNSDADGDGIADGRAYDRTGSADPNKPWRSRAPDGAVAIADAITALAQVGTDCTAAP